jgi:hypothetical protein
MAERGDLGEIPEQGPWEREDEDAPEEDAAEDETPEESPAH